LAFIGYVIRARGRQRVYVIVHDDLSDATGADVNARSWTIVETYAPRTGQNRFVVATAQPAPRR
jgi:hypothetical protein